jgi:Tol biopolymer transport system component
MARDAAGGASAHALTVDLGPEAHLGGTFLNPVLLSPDGARMVFVSRGANGIRQLSIRPLDQAKAQALAGTENAQDPFFSPDGQWIGFFADQKLKKIYVQGGAAITVCDALDPRGGTWGEDGNIIAAFRSVGPLVRVSAAGGTPRALTQLDVQKGEQTHRYPQILPGGKAVVFTAGARGDFTGSSLEVQSLQTGQRKTLQRGGFFGRYLPSGHLVYMRQDTLFAAPMDLDKLELTGPSVPVLEEVANIPARGNAQFDFSRTGTFIYVSGRGTGAGWSIAWLDSSGKTQPLLATPGRYFTPTFSPDGKRLAISVAGVIGRFNLAVYDWQRDTMTRLGSTPGPDYWSVWTPDGKGIVYQSQSAGGFVLYWVRSDGASASVQLTESKNIQAPHSFSPDGKRLAYAETGGETQDDLWTLPIDWSDPEHPKPGKPEVFLRTPAVEIDPAFSPDGRWIAYGSNEGSKPEVYVRPFPPDPSGGKWQVSNGGGRLAVWSRNCRELFYQAEDQIMVVSYTVKGASFMADKPRLWSGHRIFVRGLYPNYDLAPDGKRFAILESTEAGEAKPATQANVLLNFFDELRRRVPPGGK